MMSKLREITISGGGKINVDISDEACLLFGFRHGDVVIDPEGDQGTIMGVAPAEDKNSKLVMWYAPDDYEGQCYYWGKERDLKGEGFELVQHGPAAMENVHGDREIVLVLKVIGYAGDKTEEVMVFDMSAVAEQQRLFEAAGYKNVTICPTHAVFDSDDGVWYQVKFEGPVMINKLAVRPQYSRADINPGIPVNQYCRDVLKRPRATMAEVAFAMIVVCSILACELLVLLGILVVGIEKGGVWVFISAMGFVTAFAFASKFMDFAMTTGRKAAGIPSIEEWLA